MAITLDNPHADIDLRFRQGEPLSWTITVNGADWSGAYTAQIVNSTPDAVATLAVTATYDGGGDVTTFELSLTAAASADIAPGGYRWAARSATGEVFFRGGVVVDREVVPVV